MSLFDGMGAILVGALGARVVHRPVGGGAFDRVWHVRVYIDEAFPGEDRPIFSRRAELRLPRDQVDLVSAGDTAATGDVIETLAGCQYRIVAQIETPNPGADALVPFQLVEI